MLGQSIIKAHHIKVHRIATVRISVHLLFSLRFISFPLSSDECAFIIDWEGVCLCTLVGRGNALLTREVPLCLFMFGASPQATCWTWDICLKAMVDFTDAFSSSTTTRVRKFWLEKMLIFLFFRVYSGLIFIFNVNSEIAWSDRPDLFIKAKNKNSALKIPWRYVLWVIYLSKAYSQNACRRRKILSYFGRLYVFRIIS